MSVTTKAGAFNPPFSNDEQRRSHYVRLSHGNKPLCGLECFTVSEVLLLFRHGRIDPHIINVPLTKMYSSMLSDHVTQSLENKNNVVISLMDESE